MFEVYKNYPTVEKKSDVKLISLIVASGGSELEQWFTAAPSTATSSVEHFEES